MRDSLLGADSEARAREAAMSNLGALMASGQGGALGRAPQFDRILHPDAPCLVPALEA
jgi:hypothetical protein